MCKQPVPQVTAKDVKRIALRDFGEAQFFKVLSILDEFGKQEMIYGSICDKKVKGLKPETAGLFLIHLINPPLEFFNLFGWGVC